MDGLGRCMLLGLLFDTHLHLWCQLSHCVVAMVERKGLPVLYHLVPYGSSLHAWWVALRSHPSYLTTNRIIDSTCSVVAVRQLSLGETAPHCSAKWHHGIGVWCDVSRVARPIAVVCWDRHLCQLPKPPSPAFHVCRNLLHIRGVEPGPDRVPGEHNVRR